VRGLAAGFASGSLAEQVVRPRRAARRSPSRATNQKLGANIAGMLPPGNAASTVNGCSQLAEVQPSNVMMIDWMLPAGMHERRLQPCA